MTNNGMHGKRKIALVTGASSGIGAAIARRLSADGFETWVHYRSNREGAEQVLDSIRSTGGRGRFLRFDVSDAGEIREQLLPVLSEEGPVYALVNNAGITSFGVARTISDEKWARTMETNLSGPFRITRAILAGMIRARSGRIINIASVSGETGNVGQADYCASKAGLIGLMRGLAREYGKRNILSNVVSPGFIQTRMTSAIPREWADTAIPLRRPGLPEEVAGVVSFLCSEDSSYVTGQVISVNGGMHIA